MTQIKVNILPNTENRKPTAKEYGKLQKSICHSIQDLSFKQFAYLVGEKGYFWKSSLLVGGAKNENFKEAYVISLDFDNGITVTDFLEKSRDLGLEPTFIYHTFSHTDENNRFRAIWRLNETITDPQLKTAIQLMIMEVFPECDIACKDLSRLWVGGKKVVNYKYDNTLNIENLITAVVTTISLKDEHNTIRNLKSFYKKIGINIFEKYPFILKSVKVEEICESSNNIYYREVRKNTHILDNFKNIDYDGFIFSFDKNAYNHTKATNRAAKIQTIKVEKIKRSKIDFKKLERKCNLFNDFIKGIRLKHEEIYHLSTNLYDFEKYPTLLSDTLIKHNYNNWENKFNTYTASMNYRYSPTRCSNRCKYFNECMNPLNIKEKYYQKEAKAVMIDNPKKLEVKFVEDILKAEFEKLKDGDKDLVTLIKAPTGIGKSRMLQTLDLTNTIVAVSNHRLGEQLYNDLLKNPDNEGMIYAKPLNMDRLSDELKYKVQKFYDLGLHGEVRNLVYDEIKKWNRRHEEGFDYPPFYKDLIEFADNTEYVSKANSLLYTHHRMSFGANNKRIDRVIIDEDFLKGFIKYDYFNKNDIFEDLNKIRRWAEKFNNPNSKYYKDYIDMDCLCQELEIKLYENSNSKWFENPLRDLIIEGGFKQLLVQYIKDNKDNINMNIFKIIRAEYVSIKQDFIHFINAEDIKVLKDYRTIILSATLDEDIHCKFIQKYLPEKQIEFKDLGDVELKGNIYCDCSYSYSREGLKNITDKGQYKLDKILSSDNYENIITFMSNDLVDVKKYGKKKITHFGATEGLNGYEGQNLCVLGTPHHNSAIYEAYGVILTGKSPVSTTWKVKRIRKYGFEFDLNTYENDEDEIFTQIQLYFLYSELIQAVGRARAIRFDCDVYVYSSIPIPSAKLI